MIRFRGPLLGHLLGWLLVLAAAVVPAQTVTVTPNPVVPGQTATVRYDATGRPLAAASQVFLHHGWNGWQGTTARAMTSVGTRLWETDVTVPADAVRFDFVFNNGAGVWDNNGSRDWMYLVALDLTAYPLGANPAGPELGAGTVFRVWAPNALSASVAGTFNNWTLPAGAMTAHAPSGVWSAFVPGATFGAEYKFVFQTPTTPQLWKIDPRARRTLGTLGNAIVERDGSHYPWTATSWQTPDLDRMVIYEIHIGTFSGQGDGVPRYPATYRDVVDAHLPDLLALGVNMVQILPVHEFPAISWGYNPVHFFAPESDYGSPDDLRYMIDTLQANGIGVLHDVVYNHTSNTDNNLWDFDGPQNIYFFGNNCAGETPWGSTRPRYTAPQVRQLIVDNARYWIEEFRFDGLRVDSTVNMRGYCNEAGEGWLLMGDITDAVRAANPRAVSIAEELPNNAAVTMPRNQGGAGYDAQWENQFKIVMRGALAAIGAGNAPNMSAVANAIASNEVQISNAKMVKYVESHDEAGNDVRVVELVDAANPSSARALALAKVAGGLTLLSPGIPMLLQGQEWAESRRFGDTQALRPRWDLAVARQGMRDFYGTLVRLRTQRPSLAAGAGVQITHVNQGASVVAFQRFDLAGDITFVVANFGTTSFSSYLLGVPATGTWHELANSQDPRFDGTGAPNGSRVASASARDGQPATLDIALPANSILVFSRTPLATAPARRDLWIVQ